MSIAFFQPSKRIAIFLLLLTPPVFAEQDKWQIHSDIDLFAFSEVISVDQFAKDFKEDLASGDTAFTYNKFEFGVRFKSWHIAYVARFDYITEFTEDTAFFHHSGKNLIPLPTDREYHLRLDVERVNARGFKLGYTHEINDHLSFDVAGTYFFSATDLQSGFAEAAGDVEPIDDDLIAEFRKVTEGLTVDNRDLSPLIALSSDVRLDVNINYAYDEPKFGEKFYRKPVVLGVPNPIISGVDFSDPAGTGYSFDFGVTWRPINRLNIRADFFDLGHTINWKNAAQTRASFRLHDAIVDSIGVAQEFVDGGVVAPNDLIDRHLTVDIFNADYKQHLPWRADIQATWKLETQPNLFGWRPDLLLLGGYHHTSVQDFPRIGLGLNGSIQLFYDFGGEAVHFSYQGKYGFIKLIGDDFDTKKAHTLGIAMGANIRF